MSKSDRKNTLSVERLEAREVMSGNVQAFNYGNNLYVTEAADSAGQGQAVAISQLGNGQIRVKGLPNQDGGTSLVNGAWYQDFWLGGDLKVDLRAGNDTVQLVRNTAIMGINIDVADQTGVATADNDLVYIDGIRTDNQLIINTGRGNDAVQVWDSAIGNGFGNNDNLYVNTGVGADNVQVFTSTRSMVVRGSVYLTTYELNESDADTVRVQSLTAGGSLMVNTGAGDDRVDMTDVWAGVNVGVGTMAGNDTVNLREVRAVRDIRVNMGDDHDRLTVQYLNADRVTLDGGAGYDTLSSSIPGYANVYSAVNFEPFWGIAVKLPGDPPLSNGRVV